jgi:phosphoglycerate dehydrogenase-like enzyme
MTRRLLAPRLALAHCLMRIGVKSLKVALAHYLPSGGLDDVVAAAGPADLEIVKIDVTAPAEAQCKTIKDADALFFVFGGQMPDAVIRQASRLKFIQTMSAGYEYLNLDLLKELDIPFANSGGMNSPAVAEHTIALILSVARKLVQADAAVRKGTWLMQSPATDPFSYGELYDKRVGIVGLGNIGRNVARRLQGFNCELVYASPKRIPEEQEKELGISNVELDELFETSDIVTLHAPLTPKTKHMVNRERLAKMKSTAILINTSRGGVVDERALLDALQQGKIAGAGLDVFEPEPPQQDNPLFQLDNIVVTPHCGGGTAGMQQRMISFCWQNIAAALTGKTPKNLIPIR